MRARDFGEPLRFYGIGPPFLVQAETPLYVNQLGSHLRTSLGMWRDSLSDGLRSVLHRSPECPPVGYYMPMSWAGSDLLEDRAFHRWIDSNLGTNGAVAAVELTHHLEVLLQLSVWGIA